VSDTALVDAMETIERVNDGAAITVFEVITAAAFHLFAASPAELCVLEVGLGGRGDATNVIEHPAACAITALSLDHREMLGDTLALIAGEKAGIMKPGVPVATGAQPPEALDVLRAAALRIGSPFLARGEAWSIEPCPAGLRFSDAHGTIEVPSPALHGAHQIDNTGIALAALRAAMPGAAPLPIAAYGGVARARWPARLQRLRGDLTRLIPADWELWLDGGHNPGAGVVLADHMAGWADRPIHLVLGMKQAKDTAEFLRPLLPLVASVWAVQEPGQHLALPVMDIVAASGGVARPGPTVAAALSQLPPGPAARVLVCGSLYLAGEVLKADGTNADE
jgi:dihydrofolate synthase/folylpolyglutamate synthase